MIHALRHTNITNSIYVNELIDLEEKISDRKNTTFVPMAPALQNLLGEHTGNHDLDNLLWFNTSDTNQLYFDSKFNGLANHERINNIKYVNKYLEKANLLLDEGQYLLLACETKESRKIRILSRYPRYISNPYYFVDFFVKRVLPKWRYTRKVYFWLTNGRNRVISFTEMLGRLYSCGFSVLGHRRMGNLTWFIAKKTGEPAYDMKPTYGMLVNLRRVGYGGQIINVYKMRTMYPYSEYIQDYIYQNNQLDKGGKFKDDFRVTRWGAYFRKLWIDELPMLFNWMKGEMKLVGVRPLSLHYFQLYPVDMQELRVKVKPGLVPPFYADLPDTLEEVIDSERRYINAFLKQPIRTDISYFFKAMYNIFIKRARSK
jgi:lipopolysaccharide/colanic/teichoic acid biosynthesis glycosyltransferase